MPLIEAMACGVPVVASNTTSVPEVVKDAGVLVDPGNIPAIAQAMQKILTDSAFKEQLVQKGLVRVRDYNASALARQTYDLFKNTFKEDQNSRA